MPGALALAVTIMGTILAAMTGIIGASVTMMTALALPTMMRQGYSHALSCGTIAASGTLGILIPPSIMLIIMADLMSVSVGNAYMAGVRARGSLGGALRHLRGGDRDGEALDGAAAAARSPARAQGRDGPAGAQGVPAARVPDRPDQGRDPSGWSTPSEAGAVGAFGAILLAFFNGRLTYETMESVCHSAGRTIAMIFFIIISATCFAYVYRSLGGDDVVEHLITSAGLDFLGPAVPDHGDRVLPRLLPRLDRDHPDRPAGVRAAGRRPRLLGDHVAKEDMILWFIILMAVNLQTSFLTPPFGFALFYLKGIAPREVKIQSIYRGIIPFVILQLVALVVVMLFPNVALWLMHSVYD